MIYTVTLNPAIDKTIYVEGFQLDSGNRIEAFRSDPGGKGINVTKMIQNLGGESIAITVAGGTTGYMLEELMKRENINNKVFKCLDETRINTKMVDKVSGQFTDINEPGPRVSKTLLKDIEAYLKENVKANDIVVLSGSVPRGVPTTIYKDWCKLGESLGARVFLDADKKLLEEGIDGSPYMIKPNETELGSYFANETTDMDEIIANSPKLFAKGLKVVLVSLGKDGCVLLTKDSAVKFSTINVEVKSTVGAGDSMLAAIAYHLDGRSDDALDLATLVDAVVFGVAASSASIEREGTLMGEKQRILELKEFVKYKNA